MKQEKTNDQLFDIYLLIMQSRSLSFGFIDQIKSYLYFFPTLLNSNISEYKNYLKYQITVCNDSLGFSTQNFVYYFLKQHLASLSWIIFSTYISDFLKQYRLTLKKIDFIKQTMFEYTREHLLRQVDSKPLSEIRASPLLPKSPTQGKKQWEVLNHFLTELYLFMSQNQFPIEHKALCLNTCLGCFTHCFDSKLNCQQSRELFTERFLCCSSIGPDSLSPRLTARSHQLIASYLEAAFFRLYEYFKVAYVDYIDYNVFVEGQESRPKAERRIAEGKVVADPKTLQCLDGLVGERREVIDPKAPKKK